MSWEQAIVELESDDPDRYAEACERLDKLATADHLPQLLDLLANGRDFTIREAAAVPVARLQGVAALPHLLAAMQRGTEEGHDNDLLASVITDVVSENPAGAATPAGAHRLRIGTGSRGRSLALGLCKWRA
jgi:hypothetical protein